jgi:predicted phage terminase large subunit-like protein
MEFERRRRCATVLGWKDPRTKEDELLCPDRFPRKEVEELKRRLGLYGTAGQLQQRPAPLEGGLFKRAWFRIVHALPTGHLRRVRYRDLAAAADGDYTCGVLMSRTADGTYYVEDVRRGRWSPTLRDSMILQTAKTDGHAVEIILEQEPGSAGKSVVEYLTRKLAGYVVSADRPTGAKEVRAQPFASQCGISNLLLLAGEWNDAYLSELCVFPNGVHDDQVDASSGAFSRLARYAVEITPPTGLRVARETRPFGFVYDRDAARRAWMVN